MTALDAATQRVHRQIIRGDQSLQPEDVSAIRRQVKDLSPLLSGSEVDTVTARVSQQLFGLGPLEPLLADPDVTEIMVNGPHSVWIERRGQLSAVAVDIDEHMLRIVIERIVGPLGLRVDRTQPFVDARLVDGSRVNIAVAPLALDGPYVTIRRFQAEPLKLAEFGGPAIESLLRSAVAQRVSLIVSGGTGSGKTSLLNALAAGIRPGERVITIEDAAELRLPGEHTVRLEARPPNAEGVGQVSIRALVRNALRMRPDRLIVGEVRGAEALDMVQAMNTGHDGSMSTCHANSPIDALRRIESMVMMAEIGLPVDVVREHVQAAIGLIVHVERAEQGHRRVASIYACADGGRLLVSDGLPVDAAFTDDEHSDNA